MAKEVFKVCARYTGTINFTDKSYYRFVVVGTGTFVHISIDKTEVKPEVGHFYLIDVMPYHNDVEKWLGFTLRSELTLPKYAESIA